MSAGRHDPALGTDELMAVVGANLRAARKKLGRSQEQTALGAGLHRQEVGLIERGQRMPRIDTLLKLAGSLEVGLGEVLEGVCWAPGNATKGGSFKPMPTVDRSG